MTDNIKTNKAKSTQFRNLAILIGIVVIGFTGFIYMMPDKSSQELNASNDKANFANPLDHVDPESTVLERTQKQLRDAAKKTENLQLQINTLLDAKKSEEEKSDLTQELKKRIDVLEKQLSSPNQNQLANNTQGELIAGSREFQGDLLPTPPGSNSYNNGVRGDGIREDSLSLTPNETILGERLALKNPDTYVPSGTFAKAVMIGGADASAAVNAQANPSPMIFRIIANGTLPNHKKSHLKDCVVTAAVVGDISSERGLIRLENLSCTFPNNEIVDQSVEGTIFGPEGKNGVRGTPVWRESALLQRAFAAGTLSGLSDGLSQTYTTNSISAEGNVQTVNSGKIFQYGAAKGAGKAMDKLADYNIQRAEQYHPVIQLSAGTVVDVVFLKGFFLDGKKHENRDASVGNYAVNNSPTLFPQPEGSGEAQTLPLSPDAVRRIQEKSKELGLRVTNQPNES
ncbi:MAG TPA: TrbI/VirB10 family protein [Candidatus Babeliales bacterium]|nr:TrbI/VirB10 family protein [Candidatus Babeliales bacterium]